MVADWTAEPGRAATAFAILPDGSGSRGRQAALDRSAGPEDLDGEVGDRLFPVDDDQREIIA